MADRTVENGSTPASSPVDESSLQVYLEVFGQQLKMERNIQRFSQDQMAEASGLHRRTISDLENGKNGNFKTLLQYARALGVSFALIAARAEVYIEQRDSGITIRS